VRAQKGAWLGCSDSPNLRVLTMSIDQADTIDFATIDKDSGDLWLTISDHLGWDENEGNHLFLLQNKLNAYLRAIESGEILSKVPEAQGRNIVINLVGKVPLSQKADSYFRKAQTLIEEAGFRLQFSLMRAN
jgi:calcineurin-like phosphoesterase